MGVATEQVEQDTELGRKERSGRVVSAVMITIITAHLSAITVPKEFQSRKIKRKGA